MPPLLPGDRPSRMPAREIEIVDEMWNSMMADFASAGADIMDKDIMLIDNRNDSYRRPKDGILFVPRAPHQIRPPADTGVHYRLDEADQEFTLSLNDPPQLSDYQWNSVQLETEHNVCQACLDILNYYCRYAEARLTVSGPLEATISRKTNFGSTKNARITIGLNICYQIPLFIISISSLCLLLQLYKNAFCVRCF